MNDLFYDALSITEDIGREFQIKMYSSVVFIVECRQILSTGMFLGN
jgi:hypothetical protein